MNSRKFTTPIERDKDLEIGFRGSQYDSRQIFMEILKHFLVDETNFLLFNRG